MTTNQRAGYKSKSSERNNHKTAIWKNLEDAKMRQESIRNRLRKYGHDDMDSDYSDSPSSDNSDSDSDDEYDDEFDLNNVSFNPTPSQASAAIQSEPKEPPRKKQPTLSQPMSPTKKKNFLEGGIRQNIKKNLHSSKSSSNRDNCNSQKKLQSCLKSRARQDSASVKAQKGEKLPPLTPEEAIRLVMERHTYISDSDESEDEKGMVQQKSSSTTTETTDTTSSTFTSKASNREREVQQNRTTTGKRVLALKKKKHREDTHPRTSAKRQQDNIERPRSIPRSNQEERLQQPKVTAAYQPSRSTDIAQKHVIRKRMNDNNITQSSEPVSTPLRSLVSLHPPGVFVEDERDRREKVEMNQCHNRYHTYGDNDNDDDACIEENGLRAMDQEQHQEYRPSKIHVEKAEDKKKNLPISMTLTNKTTTKKNPGRNIDSSSSGSSDDDDEYDDNFLDKDVDIFQRSSNHSTLKTKSDRKNGAEGMTDLRRVEKIVGNGDTESIDSTYDDDNEENWGDLSFKTAKTSKSQYSKASATALWRKAMAQDDNGDENDDIFFFDAIQEVGEASFYNSVKISDAPPVIITDKRLDIENEPLKNDDGSNQGDEDADVGGWTEKLTNLVGYTIGALSGGNDLSDDDNEEDGLVDPAPFPKNASLLATRSLKNKSSKKNLSKSPANNSKVPSRELEIIKKCQAQMKIQQREVEKRELEILQNNRQNIELRRQEEAARARVFREVMNYRKMMEGMGKEDKLAPLDSKLAAQEYDDRLAMGKTLEEQERKMKLNERNMRKLDGEPDIDHEHSEERGGCVCSCVVS